MKQPVGFGDCLITFHCASKSTKFGIHSLKFNDSFHCRKTCAETWLCRETSSLELGRTEPQRAAQPRCHIWFTAKHGHRMKPFIGHLLWRRIIVHHWSLNVSSYFLQKDVGGAYWKPEAIVTWSFPVKMMKLLLCRFAVDSWPCCLGEGHGCMCVCVCAWKMWSWELSSALGAWNIAIYVENSQWKRQEPKQSLSVLGA